jgi:hypothetical protein
LENLFHVVAVLCLLVLEIYKIGEDCCIAQCILLDLILMLTSVTLHGSHYFTATFLKNSLSTLNLKK